MVIICLNMILSSLTPALPVFAAERTTPGRIVRNASLRPVEVISSGKRMASIFKQTGVLALTSDDSDRGSGQLSLFEQRQDEVAQNAGASPEAMKLAMSAFDFAQGAQLELDIDGSQNDAGAEKDLAGSRTSRWIAPPAEEKHKTPLEIFRARYGTDEEIKLLDKAQHLEAELNRLFAGQKDATHFVADTVMNYLQTYKTRKAEPELVVLPGLAGIGKSDMAVKAAEFLGVPYSSVSLQYHVGKEGEVVDNFAGGLARYNKADGKPAILILDELDKVYEIDEKGNAVDRPVIGIVNELLNSGNVRHAGKYFSVDSNFSKVLVVVTLNFRKDVYGRIEDHPDLTSIEDLQHTHKQVATHSVDISHALRSMFKENTVTRLLSGIHVMKPLDAPAYRKLIEIQKTLAIARVAPDDQKAVKITVLPKLEELFFQEAVIPTTGARHTIRRVGKIIETAFQHVLVRLPKDWQGRPVEFAMDYDAFHGEVVVAVTPAAVGESEISAPLTFRYPLILQFAIPPLASDAEISGDRFQIAAHEFGHAMAHVLYGVPFIMMRVVPISSKIGGFVKSHWHPRTGRQIYAQLLALLGSRAMERIVQSSNPKDRPASYLDVTTGATGDIEQATVLLLKTISAFGLDSNFGPISRYVNLTSGLEMTQPVPETMYQRAAEVLIQLEQFLVEDLLTKHSVAWYKKKIASVARAGRLTEKQFYEIIGYQHPDGTQKSESASPLIEAATKENVNKAVEYIQRMDLPKRP